MSMNPWSVATATFFVIGCGGLVKPCHGAEDQKAPESRWEFLAQRYDKDGDGRISKKEYDRDKQHWQMLDVDENGYIEASDLQGKGKKKPGKKKAAKKVTEPKEGKAAPLFNLHVLPEEGIDELSPKKPKTEKVSLKSFRGDKPVALIFGSYT